ncbi:Methyltransferase type 11 [Methanosalsum zhilinae DSM 4017]|uniref:Methyltransferase type 11 n=1 Tax=Methanosalsum zhilinae (strain DSM 4017 / NBRC 107636 / OCM 62 / WeN5) TaxID=679901 RepID=F7XM13_METZD|nr:class I SAM-dependent methyltransferase [Methanosalsum zhilinae]AEH60950.1 Methyltransferase type 11 [Methanosalsum zhilinae DSM 4017]
MKFEAIGTVFNHAYEDSLKILAFWKDCVSAIEMKNDIYVKSLFSDEYSHYIIIHDPLTICYSEEKDEWNRRFSQNAGISIVKFLKSEENIVYVKGLFAENSSSVYTILPYTMFDEKEAQFPISDIENTRKKLMKELIPHIHGTNILDIGCGIGSITMEIAQHNPKASVYGVEISDNMVRQSKMNSMILKIENSQFQTANVYNLPFKSKSIDVATCFFMLHHLTDIPAAISEIKRILTDDGILIAADPMGHHHGPQFMEDDWKMLFEEAGFNSSVKKIGKAAVSFSQPIDK